MSIVPTEEYSKHIAVSSERDLADATTHFSQIIKTSLASFIFPLTRTNGQFRSRILLMISSVMEAS